MAVYQKILLSGSTNGRPIRVTALVSDENGTTLHTAGAATTNVDELWIWAVNTVSDARELTIKFGATASTDEIEFSVPGEDGLYTVVPGIPLNNALVVRAYATVSTDINVVGYVNRVVSAT